MSTRWLGAIPAVALVAIATWETCATRRDAASVPDQYAWARAEDAVRAGFQPGDLVVFAPRWIDPVGRLHLGDLLPVDVAARMDADRFGRIWEVSIRGARAPETAGLDPTVDVPDEVTVRRYDRKPVTVITDLRGEESRPRLPRTLDEVGFDPHDCLEIAPKQRATFSNVNVGSTLVGYAGIPDIFDRRDNREPGTLTVEVDGKTATATAGVDDGWVRFEVATTPGVATITVSATGRKLCWAAEARE